MRNLYEVIPQDQFELDKVKLKQRKAVAFVGHSQKAEGSKTFEMTYQAEVAVIPHEDLLAAVDKLKSFFADYFGYTHCKDVAMQSKFAANKEQSRMLNAATASLLSDITVTGFSYASKRDAAIITGMYKGCAMNTKHMKFANPTWGEGLQHVCDEISDEVYAFVFEGKVAQLDAFDDAPKDGKKAAAGDS